MTVFLLFFLKSFVYLFLIYILFGIDWSQFKNQVVWCIILFSFFTFLLLFLKLPIEMTVIAHGVYMKICYGVCYEVLKDDDLIKIDFINTLTYYTSLDLEIDLVKNIDTFENIKEKYPIFNEELVC